MKPWYKSRDYAWFVTLRLPDGGRKQERLCDGQANEAWVQLCRYQSGQVKAPTKLTTAAAFDAFLDWDSREKKPATFEHYRYFRQSFADIGVKAKPVSDLIPHHLTKWPQANTWNSTSRNRAVS